MRLEDSHPSRVRPARRQAFHCLPLKAYECLEHSHLRQMADRYGFNLLMLRWLLSLYTMPRRLKVKQTVTEVVNSSRSIVPGDASSDLLLKVALLPILDEASTLWPRVFFGVVSDDLQVVDSSWDGSATQAADFFNKRVWGDGSGSC